MQNGCGCNREIDAAAPAPDGAIVGELVAGFVLAVWVVIGEVVTHAPSQLTTMERQIAGWLAALRR
jgi:hypothetical protein